MKLEERMDQANLRDLGNFEPDEMIEDLDQIAASPKVSLRDLYYRWERTNWSVHELDFATDVDDWRALGDVVTERLLWVMSMFFHGEECVTATLAPWVNSAPNEEMQLFLSTQLADEARHTVFFDRFFEEVIGADGDLRERLDWCRPRINDGFQKLFYELLPSVAAEVNAHPGDPVVFARGVALYHILLEGALAVPGQKYILAFCRDQRTLPAFRAGFTAVARDESRHVGAGVRILQDLIRMDRDAIPAVQELLCEGLPLASQQFQPPKADFTYLSVLGYDSTELFRFGLESLAKRLRVAGVPFPRIPAFRLPSLDGYTPVLPERPLSPVQEMMRPMRDQITPQLVFEGLPMVFNPEAAKGIDADYQFDITGEGGGTWTIRISQGACEVVEGPSPDPEWRLELDRETWIDMTTGEFFGQEAFLLGKVTLEGNPLAGANFDKLFAPPAA